MSLCWFTYTWASWSIQYFFRHFIVKKTRLPLPADWLFCLLHQWVAYMNAICEEFMWKKRAFAPKLFVYRREIKGSETFFRLILSEKNWFQIKTTHRLSISDINILLLTRKIGKPYKVCNFLLTQWTKFLPFFKVGAWCTAKTCTCLFFFSILKYGTTDSKWRYRWCHFLLFHSSLSNSLFVYAIKSKLHGNHSEVKCIP